MVNRVLLKETKKFIKKNIKTYIAQVIIIMLGVGFFVGMKVASIDLQDTMTTFVEENNFYDIRANLEYGIEEEDIEKLAKELKEVKYVEGAYSLDIVNTMDGEDVVLRLHSYNPNKNINGIKLKDGKLPENTNECVIDTKMYNDGYNIGDEITINNEYLTNKKLKIVGLVQSPEYLAVDRGNSMLLSGKINYYIYVNESNIESNVYTDLNIKFDTDYEAFTEKYDNFVEKKEIESYYIISGYFKDKYNDIITEQQLKITTAKAEYQAQKAKVDAQFVEAENELKNKEELLNDAKASLLTDAQINQKVKDAISNSKAEVKQELDRLKKQVDAAKAEYEKYKNNHNVEITNTQNKINENNTKIVALEKEIEANEKKLAELQAEYDSMNDYITNNSTSCYPGFLLSSNGKCCYMGMFYCYTPYGNSAIENPQKAALKSQIEELEAKISEQKIEKASLENENINLNKVLNASNKLAEYQNKYNLLKAQYDEKLKLYNSMGSESQLLNHYKDQNNKVKSIIKQYENEFATAKKDLEAQKKVAYAQLDAAKLKIQNGEDMINSLSYPSSYVFNRRDNSGYGQFISDIEKISNLAIVVPVVFYFITFFMISASINRMLHEERNQIGTLKAIGIRDGEIIIKYLIYSISSVIIGSILGMVVGTIILPLFVYFIYEMLYEFPNYSLKFSVYYFFIATLMAFGVAIVSTLICCKETFSEIPVSLLKAKQEKETQNSFFEKIPSLWNKLSLTSKISFKNIFRYKARMFMTIVGIGGCLALMLTGLSLRTSITEMIPTQYGKLFKVDAQIFYKDLVLREDITKGTEKILALDTVETGLLSNYQTFTADCDGKILNVNSVVFYDQNYSDFIELNDAKTKNKLTLNDDGVIISEKFAKMKDVDVGEIIKIKDKEQKEYSLIVSGIAENYIEHYVYMTATYYEKVFAAEPRSNMLLLKLTGEYDEIKLAQEINNSGIVSQVLYISIAQKAYENVMDNLALLVGVFMVFSILLVFAVLYNLININIRERAKEIATYKVLGFSNKKVIKIVKRENIVLMFLGIILGLIFGYFLSIIVIMTCEVENLNFLKTVTLENCIISIVSTIVFTLIFSMIINRYVKKINLTESLKSNE